MHKVGIGSAKKMLFKRGSSDYISLRTHVVAELTVENVKIQIAYGEISNGYKLVLVRALSSSILC